MATNAQGEKKAVPIPTGTNIVIDVPGLHYNRGYSIMKRDSQLILMHWLARYWEDPETFKPARFLQEWPRDAFLPFSAGM